MSNWNKAYVALFGVSTQELFDFIRGGSDERMAGLIVGVPLKRVGKPEEIVESILFLSSDKASFIRGAKQVRRSQSTVAKRPCDSYKGLDYGQPHA